MPSCWGLTTEPFLFLQAGCFFVTTLMVPQFLQDRVCRNLYNSTVCDTLSTNKKTPHEDRIQEIASLWRSVFPISSLLFSTISMCFIGPLADMIGKRKMMIAAPIMTMTQSIIFIIFSRIDGYFHPAWIFIPMTTPSLTGDVQGAILLSLAYKADVTNKSERTRAMTRTEGFFFFSLAVASLVTGLVLKEWGYITVFSGNAVMSLVSLLYVIFVLPDEKKNVDKKEQAVLIQEDDEEDEIPKGETNVKEQKMTDLLNLQLIRKVLRTKSDGQSIIFYLVFFLIAMFTLEGLLSISVFYFSHSPFNQREDQLGYLVAFSAIMSALGDWFVVPLLQHYARFDDVELLIVGFLSITTLLVLYGTAVALWMVYVAQVFTLSSYMTLAVSRSIVTKQVSDENLGSAMAVVEIVDTIISTVVDFLANFVYSQTLSTYHGIAMFMLALGGVAGAIYSTAFRQWKRKK